jgi:hypothetical protein
MKKALPVLLAALLGAAGLHAQGTSVTLQNQEESWFYFAIDLPELAGLPPNSPQLPSRVASFFAKPTEDFPFTALKPRASLSLEALPEGSHTLFGFFLIEGRNVFPVRTMTLQVDKRLGQRFYGIYSEPPLMMVPRGTGRLARFGPAEPQPAAAAAQAGTIAAAAQTAAGASTSAAAAAAQTSPAEVSTLGADAAAAAPEAEKPSGQAAQPGTEPAAVQQAAAQPPAQPPQPLVIGAYPATFSPVVFSRESADGFSMHPISESRFWNREGTRLASVTGYRTGPVLTLTVASSTRFSPYVSYFLYLFADRTLARQNAVTVEIRPAPPAGAPAIAALWSAGVQKPAVVGRVTASEDATAFSLVVEAGELPRKLFAGTSGSPSVDLTACYFDEATGVYEEFSYATFSLADLPDLTR